MMTPAPLLPAQIYTAARKPRTTATVCYPADDRWRRTLRTRRTQARAVTGKRALDLMLARAGTWPLVLGVTDEPVA
jgi:hypothetical protein